MTDRHTDQPRPTVFFDGSCPLCSREIRHYRRLPGAEAIRWVDASRDPTSLAAAGLDRETAMRRLHTRDGEGEWLVGVDAFLVIWRRLPRYRWLARFVGIRPIRRVTAWGYDRFADWRYRRRCTTSCRAPEER